VLLIYYYDVMELCEKKSQTMTDRERMEYIYAGMDREYARRIIRCKHRTPADILEELCAEEYADKMVNCERKAAQKAVVNALSSTSTYAAYERKPSTTSGGTSTLSAAVQSSSSSSDLAELKSMLEAVLKNVERGSRPQRGRGGKFLPRRNEKGERLCFNCKKYGHISIDCPEGKRLDEKKEEKHEKSATKLSSSQVTRRMVRSAFVSFSQPTKEKRLP